MKPDPRNENAAPARTAQLETNDSYAEHDTPFPAPSNSGELRNKMSHPVLGASLDRLGFTVKIRPDDQPAFRRFIENDLAVGCQMRAKAIGYRYGYSVGDFYLEVGDKASGACKDANAIVVRFDFNPNNASIAELARIGDGWLGSSPWRITRVDVAIDYALDLSSSIMRHDTLRKVHRYGKNGKHETIYFGSVQGDRLIRVYDKRQERMDRGAGEGAEGGAAAPDQAWWRVEVQYRPRGSEPLPAGLFDGLCVGSVDWDALDPKMYCMLRTLVEEPDALFRFERRARVRWKNRFNGLCDPLDPSPQSVYAEHRDGLTFKLDAWQGIAAGTSIEGVI